MRFELKSELSKEFNVEINRVYDKEIKEMRCRGN